MQWVTPLSVRKACLGCFLLLSLLLHFMGVSVNAGSIRYRDIYLTEGRVCRACTWTIQPKGYVQLTNRSGQSSVVFYTEIAGIDEHPIARKVFTKSLHNIGLSAKAIVPYAFPDGQDFVCKYCPSKAE